MSDKRESKPICIPIVGDVLWDVHAVAQYLGVKVGSVNDMMYRKGRQTTLPAPLSMPAVDSPDYTREMVERLNLRLWSALAVVAYGNEGGVG